MSSVANIRLLAEVASVAFNRVGDPLVSAEAAADPESGALAPSELPTVLASLRGGDALLLVRVGPTGSLRLGGIAAAVGVSVYIAGALHLPGDAPLLALDRADESLDVALRTGHRALAYAA